MPIIVSSRSAVGLFSLHRGDFPCTRDIQLMSMIRRTPHLFSESPANDTKEIVFGHRNLFSPQTWIECQTGKCADHRAYTIIRRLKYALNLK